MAGIKDGMEAMSPLPVQNNIAQTMADLSVEWRKSVERANGTLTTHTKTNAKVALIERCRTDLQLTAGASPLRPKWCVPRRPAVTQTERGFRHATQGPGRCDAADAVAEWW